jgi:hypothetical protein
MRILGAIRFVDSISRSTVMSSLVVRGPGLRVLRNLSGLYVIAEGPGTEVHTGTFELPRPPLPPVPPAIGSVNVALTVIDPSGRYLARSATVAVPRDPDPVLHTQPSSLFRPFEVELFPSPTMPLGEGWATLRISVKRWGSEIGLPFAFVRVRRASDNAVLARGLADERGEALVGVPGIPITTWNAGSSSTVTTSTVEARIAACFDPAAFEPTTDTYPDPGALEQAFSTLPHSSDLQLNLAAGRELARRIDVTVPP